MNQQPYSGLFDQLPVPLAREQLGFLSRHAFVHFWLHALSATLLCALLWMKAPVSHVLLIAWLLASLGVALGRWWISQYFGSKSRLSHKKSQKNLQNYRFITLTLCALWGISAVILFYDEPLLMALHIIMLLVISVSMLPSLVIARLDYYLQLAVLLLPCVFMLLLQSGLRTHLLAMMLLVFSGTLLLTARVMEKLLNRLFANQQSLLEQIHTDPVTQLVNRSHFDFQYKTEWQRAAYQQSPLSLLLIEINDFHALDFSQGTHVSDQYLRILTHCIKTVTRHGTDVLARYGQAEFVALLPDTTREQALALATRLQQEVDATDMGIRDENNEEYLLTISIGISTCIPKVQFNTRENDTGQTDEILYPAMLLSAAGRALHRARKAPGGIAYELDDEHQEEVTVFSTPVQTDS